MAADIMNDVEPTSALLPTQPSTRNGPPSDSPPSAGKLSPFSSALVPIPRNHTDSGDAEVNMEPGVSPYVLCWP